MAALPKIDVAQWIDVDWTAFDPWRIQAVRHHLQDHPLLRLDELVALAQRLEAQGSVRTHSDSTERNGGRVRRRSSWTHRWSFPSISIFR